MSSNNAKREFFVQLAAIWLVAERRIAEVERLISGYFRAPDSMEPVARGD